MSDVDPRTQAAAKWWYEDATAKTWPPPETAPWLLDAAGVLAATDAWDAANGITRLDAPTLARLMHRVQCGCYPETDVAAYLPDAEAVIAAALSGVPVHLKET